MKMKLQIVILLALFTSAFAEPFSSGKTGTMPSSGSGTRVPAQKSTPSTSAAMPAATKSAPAKPAADQLVVRQHAEKYYRTQAASGAGVQLAGVSVTLEKPLPVPGWENRFRTTGTAKLVTSNKGTQQQEIRSFDAITENGKVIDFNAK